MEFNDLYNDQRRRPSSPSVDLRRPRRCGMPLDLGGKRINGATSPSNPMTAAAAGPGVATTAFDPSSSRVLPRVETKAARRLPDQRVRAGPVGRAGRQPALQPAVQGRVARLAHRAGEGTAARGRGLHGRHPPRRRGRTAGRGVRGVARSEDDKGAREHETTRSAT